MSGRRYGQYCGLAKAMELVGERWAMLVVRDLVLRPKSLPELQATLPGIPPTTLTTRLNELEAGRVVQRRLAEATVRYELTPYGRQLEDVLADLGAWGARSLGAHPAPDEVFTPDSAVLALRATFTPDGGEPAVFVVDMGATIVTARVSPTSVEVAEGRADDADLTLGFRGSPMPLLTGEITAARARQDGLVVAHGDVDLLDRFPRLFSVGATPAPAAPLIPA
ncbi:winged helix-turn-helix transcriptional regulator [Actinomycetospora aeridis]|uniref:Helix-turn-helix domain-containing protein n=1 Tax=Actinomycetospora aeridis TaxID=3129231 RepID=A0ABU8N276_9PSEU